MSKSEGHTAGPEKSLKPKGSRQNIQKPAQEPKLLDYYWALANDDPKARLEAAVGLIKGLVAADSEKDWNYAFERLVKGLSSSRGSVRLGYSMALSEVLEARADSISVSQYLDLCIANFDVPASAKGYEERGLNFGMLFALKTLCQSPLLLKESSTLADYEMLLNTSLALADRKVWLRESVFFALCDLIPRLTKASFDFEEAIKLTLSKVHEAGLTLTSEGVALYVSLPPALRSVDLPLKNSWKHNDPLAKGNLVVLAKALREVPQDGQGESENTLGKQKGNWKPSLHFVWSLLANHFVTQPQAQTNDEPKHKKHKSSKKAPEQTDIQLEEFWKTVVDETLFSSSSSSERKYWGFEIFCLFLQRVGPSQVPGLFSPNLTRSLINQLAQQDRLLNKAAKRVISTITDVASNQPDVSFELVKAIIEKAPGFDAVTKTKTVATLIQNTHSSHLLGLVDVLCNVFKNPNEAEQKAIEVRRQWALDSVLGLVKTRRTEANAFQWIDSIVNFLVRFAFFKDLGPEISETTVDQCQSRLSSVLSLSGGVARDDNKTWAYSALSTVIALETEGRELRVDFEGDLLKAKQKAVKTVEKIRKKRSSSTHADTQQLQAFELLFSLVLIQVFSSDSEAASILDELQLVYNRMLGKARNEEGDEDEDMDASQVLTEILLSFCSRRSALLRRLSETVWESFTSKISREGLQLLYDVLEARESADGQEDMFENNDDEMDVDGDEENEEGTTSEESESDNDESEDSEDESNEDSDEDDEAIREAEETASAELAKALGIAVGSGEEDDDDESDDDEDEDDNDESMDDEQMMALDGQLANIFRERQKVLSAHQKPKGRKQDALEARQNMAQFKSRVLDLIEIYVKNEQANPLLLTAIPALLTMIRITKDKALGEKAHQLIRNKLCRVREIPQLTAEDIEPTLEILASIHAQARRSTNKSHSLACNQTSTFVSKVLLNHDKALCTRVVEVYSSSLSEWIQKSHSRITAPLFFDLINYVGSTKRQK